MRALSLGVVLAATVYAGGAAAQTCTTLPYNLQNGATADATQVMADFNGILNCPHFSTATLEVDTSSAPSTNSLYVRGPDGHSFTIAPSAGNGSWNNITQSGDTVLMYTAGTPGTGGLDIMPWASAMSGIRMNSNGWVGIGTTPSAHLHVYNTAAGPVNFMVSGYGPSGNQWGSVWQSSTDAYGSSPLMFENASGSGVGSITTTATSTSFNTSSDRRIKENISAATRGLNVVDKIPVRDFNFINDPHKRRVEGFIAQELYKFYPEAVTTNGDDGVKPLAKGAAPWSVDYGRLTPLLVKSIQELKAANDELAAQIAALKAENADLHAELRRIEANGAKGAAR